MGTRRSIMQLLDAEEAASVAREAATLRAVARAYTDARQRMIGIFMDAVARYGPQPTAGQLLTLSNDRALIAAITAALDALQLQLVDDVGDGLEAAALASFEAAAAEVGVLASIAGVSIPAFAADPFLQLTIGPAIDQIPDMVATLRGSILAGMREGLAAGDRVGDIAAALFGLDESAFTRGRTSAQLLTRRAIVQAENNARMITYHKARETLPALKKQAIAAIGGRTTDVCLRAHGQIQELDQPFHVVGKPSFGSRQQQPPFHWNCRTRAVAYLPVFEDGSAFNTQSMQAAAAREMASR